MISCFHRDNILTSELQEFEDSRAFSPSLLEQRLEEKIIALERASEAAAKRSKDLEMMIKKLKQENSVSNFLLFLLNIKHIIIYVYQNTILNKLILLLQLLLLMGFSKHGKVHQKK